jgi:hypothetical protein
MRRRNLVLLGALLGCVALGGVYCCGSPAVRSEAEVRERLLRLTPIGSDAEAVREIVGERFADSCRFGISEAGLTESHPMFKSHGAVHKITACIGDLAFGAAFGKWYFDEQARLIEIQVTKETDLP